MANITVQKKPYTLTEQFIEFVTGSTFTICLDIALTVYTVVLAHAAITGHPLPFADLVVMMGLATVEASLVTLIFRIKSGKIDSQPQYWITCLSIVAIALCVALNALSGVAVIRETPIAELANFVSYGTPLVPVVTLILMFLCDASADSVQASIRRAISDAALTSAKNQSRIDAQNAETDRLSLELERVGATRMAERARIAAQIEIAQAEAAVLAEVARKSAEVRKTVMIEYVDGAEFKKTQARTAKQETLALLKSATQPTAQNGNTPNA